MYIHIYIYTYIFYIYNHNVSSTVIARSNFSSETTFQISMYIEHQNFIHTIGKHHANCGPTANSYVLLHCITVSCGPTANSYILLHHIIVNCGPTARNRALEYFLTSMKFGCENFSKKRKIIRIFVSIRMKC